MVLCRSSWQTSGISVVHNCFTRTLGAYHLEPAAKWRPRGPSQVQFIDEPPEPTLRDFTNYQTNCIYKLASGSLFEHQPPNHVVWENRHGNEATPHQRSPQDEPGKVAGLHPLNVLHCLQPESPQGVTPCPGQQDKLGSPREACAPQIGPRIRGDPLKPRKPPSQIFTHHIDEPVPQGQSAQSGPPRLTDEELLNQLFR